MDLVALASLIVGLLLGSLLLAVIGAVVLRAGAAVLAKGHALPLGRAVRCVFYPVLLANIASRGVQWGIGEDAGGSGALLAAGTHIAVLFFMLASFVSGELRVSFGRAAVLTLIVQGALFVLGLGVYFAALQAGYDFR